MWGSISTEASYQLNFNTTFSTTRSDVLVHLAQWQYWWWFWFSFVWSLYYFIFLRVFKFRSLKMRPKISTSFRPHGKWGDFLAAIIPALWCLNILTNSNFILRLIEWQNESSLFSVRVRARQWYWIYKYELKTLTDILSVPKNIGTNKWFFSFFGDLQISDDYLHILQLRRNEKILKSYWLTITSKLNESKNFKNFFFNESNMSYINKIPTYAFFSKNFNNNFENLNNNNFYFNNFKLHFNLGGFFFGINRAPVNFFSFLNDKLNFFIFDSVYKQNKLFNDYTEVSRFIKKQQGVKIPFRLVKNLFFLDEFENSKLFKCFFNDGVSYLENKQITNTSFLVLKQKKYARKDNISTTCFIKNINGKNQKICTKNLLINNSIFNDFLLDNNVSYRLIKKNKKRNEMISTALAKRLLRTKRTLVLPAHMNITVITNSFDIVHSWFIPGLGVKLDCVPGRSTHHTFYIDNVGFYFGQCAEICGRYHHHMPIRVCALPFEHFLVWWNIFGLPRLLNVSNDHDGKLSLILTKYVW